MKKSFVLLLALVVLISGTACYAQSDLLKEKDQVHITEKVLYGDKSVVEGVKVDANYDYEEQMFWHTLYEIGETPKEETEYTFYSIQHQDGMYADAGSLSFQMDCTDVISNDYDRDRTYYAMEKAMKELYDSTAPGEEKEVVVYLKDYIEYYTFIHDIDFPSMSGVNTKEYDHYGYWRLHDLLYDIETLEKVPESKETLEQLSELKQLLKDVEDFQEFFKIPVLDTEAYAISLKKDETGEIIGMGMANHNTGMGTGEIDIPNAPNVEGIDSFTFGIHSVFDDGDCYFTFDPHTESGKVVDTSLIPGGYGLYHFTYDDQKGTIDLENLKMVYALDPKLTLEELRVDTSGKNLLITVSDATTRYMQIIDRETMTLVDTLNLGDNEAYFTIWNYEDYMIIRAENIMLFEYGENGRYTQALSLKLEEVEKAIADCSPGVYFMEWNSAFDWNGESLLIANEIISYDENFRTMRSCNFYVAAVDATGLLYYGEYTVTLDASRQGGHKYCYFDRDMDNPIQIKWK